MENSEATGPELNNRKIGQDLANKT